MQYALMKLKDNNMFLLDAAEIPQLKHDYIAEAVPYKEANEVDSIVYGIAMARSDHFTTVEELENEIRKHLGFGFKYIKGKKSYLYELKDILFSDHPVGGQVKRVAFTALVAHSGELHIPTNKDYGITSYLCYADCDQRTNIQMSRYILSIRSLGKRETKKYNETQGDWKELTDITRTKSFY